MNTKLQKSIYVSIILAYLYQYALFLQSSIKPSEETYHSPTELFYANIEHLIYRWCLMLLFLYVNTTLHGSWERFNTLVIFPIALMRFCNEILYIFTQIKIGYSPLLLAEFLITSTLAAWALRKRT